MERVVVNGEKANFPNIFSLIFIIVIPLTFELKHRFYFFYFFFFLNPNMLMTLIT
jgi:hypothetical protein